MSRSTTRRTPRLENLEARKLLSADISGTQQLMLELINEALIDPEAAADRVEQGLTRGAINAISGDGDTVKQVIAEIADANPRPPVAWDADLAAAAEKHTEFQIELGRQTHNGPRGLESATDRVISAGYEEPGPVAENIIYGVDSPEHAMRAFLADYGKSNADDPHRENIQQTEPGKKGHQEVGVAILPVEVVVDAGTPFGTPKAPMTETKLVVTQVFARKEEAAPKLLGVVYDDADDDQFYDVGEGIAGASVTITEKATGDSTALKTWASGGYQAEVRPGNYQIEVRVGDRLLGRRESSVDEENEKVDFRATDAPKSSAQVASPGKNTTSRADSVQPVTRAQPSTRNASTMPAVQQQAPATPTVRVTAPARATPTESKATPDRKAIPPAPPTRPTTSIDPSNLPTIVAPASGNPTAGTPNASEHSKAAERLRNLATRSQAQPSDSGAGNSAISLLRSSLSGVLRSWKIAEPEVASWSR